MVRPWLMIVFAAAALPLHAQTPQPFPRANEPRQPAQAQAPAPAAPVTSRPQAAPAPVSPTRPTAAPAAPPAPSAQASTPGTPASADLGFPVLPSAQFLGAYDAGRGQRYHLFGTTAPFAEVVTFYRTQLNEKGNLVFKEPPTHMFEVGRFREETMAFPPGVTVKDWTWGGSQGYLNPKAGAQPARFPTVIMIVPAPAGAAAGQR
jgi:hypothetical protein